MVSSYSFAATIRDSGRSLPIVAQGQQHGDNRDREHGHDDPIADHARSCSILGT
jgi:hypothetical protein